MKTINANISTLQLQQQQQQLLPQKQEQQLLLLRNKLHQNQQQQKQQPHHYYHHHHNHNGKQLRAISDEKQQEEKKVEDENNEKNDDDIIYESLPQALQQRMQLDDMNYDNDKNDNTERPNRSLMDMDIISVDGMPPSSSSSSQSFKVDHNMDQPIKVLTLGGESQENMDDKDEGSANFDNNNNDDDDDDDDDDDVADEDNDNGFYKSQDKNKNNNNNGAIKIISTPLDKVGIFYDEHESSSKKTETTHSFTDFDALSPDPKSNHNSNSKITPVLTPDGKVALLYHEDAEPESKEEPIFNTTKRISVGGANDIGNNKNAKNNHKKNMHDDDGNAPVSDDDDYDYEDDEDDEEDNNNNNNDNMVNNLNDAAPVRQNDSQDQQTAADHVSESNAITVAPGSSSSLVRPTDSVLPIINRPLSEVLGIKKNQFKQFRIKDSATSTTTPRSTTTLSSSSTPWPQPAHALATGLEPDLPLHVPKANEKFNFGGVPGLQEVDFSRDNIMLSERNKAMDVVNNAAVEQKVEEIVEKKIQDEVINLAILPILEEELERLQQQNRRYYRPRPKHTEEELSDIHCVMQIIMGIAAVSTVFGMLGTFFKQRILDQLRMLH